MRRNDRCLARPAVWLAGLALALLPAVWGVAQQPPGNVPPTVVGPEFKPSEYWLGVVSGLVPDSLRAHLSLKEDEGLLVEEVAPDSPAAAAKLQRYDIVLKADGRSLAGIEDLIAAIDAAKGKKLALEILRKGKPMKVDVTPAKRPPDAFSGLLPRPGVDPWGEAMRKWLEQMRPGDPRSREYSLYFLRPGLVLAKPGKMPDLPNNVTITITKQGKDPAKIAVTRGDEKWEVTEGELGKLPADLRPHVEWMLRHGLQGVLSPMPEGRLHWTPGAPAPPAPPKAEARREKRPEGRAGSEPAKSIEKQIDEMNRRLDEMRKAVDGQVDEMRKAINELQESRSKLPNAPKLQPPK